MPRQDIAPAPRRITTGICTPRGRGRYRFHASFRQVRAFNLLETGIQAVWLSPYRADLPARRPVRIGSGCRFPGMLLSPSPFGSRVSHQIQRHLLQSMPATQAIQQCAAWRTQIGGYARGYRPGFAELTAWQPRSWSNARAAEPRIFIRRRFGVRSSASAASRASASAARRLGRAAVSSRGWSMLCASKGLADLAVSGCASAAGQPGVRHGV